MVALCAGTSWPFIRVYACMVNHWSERRCAQGQGEIGITPKVLHWHKEKLELANWS